MDNKEAIKWLKYIKDMYSWSVNCDNALNKAIESIENEKPIGYWKIINDKYVECSNCNKRSLNQLTYAPMYYCNICGASMHIKYKN